MKRRNLRFSWRLVTSCNAVVGYQRFKDPYCLIQSGEKLVPCNNT